MPILKQYWRRASGAVIGLILLHFYLLGELALYPIGRATASSYFDALPFPFAATNIRVVSHNLTGNLYKAIGALYTGALERALVIGEPSALTRHIQSWSVYAGVSNYAATSIFVHTSPYWQKRDENTSGGFYQWKTDSIFYPDGVYWNNDKEDMISENTLFFFSDYCDIRDFFGDTLFYGTNYSSIFDPITNWIVDEEYVNSWFGWPSGGTNPAAGTVMTGMYAIVQEYTRSVTLSKTILTTNLIPGTLFSYSYHDPNGTGMISASGRTFLTQSFIDRVDSLLSLSASSGRFIDLSLTNSEGTFKDYLAGTSITTNTPPVTNHPGDFPRHSFGTLFAQLPIGFSDGLSTNDYGQISVSNYGFTRVPARVPHEWIVSSWHFYAGTNGTGWISRYDNIDPGYGIFDDSPIERMNRGLRSTNGAVVCVVPEYATEFEIPVTIDVTGLVLNPLTWETNDHIDSYTLSDSNWYQTDELWLSVTGIGGNAFVNINMLTAGTTGNFFRVGYTGSVLVAGGSRWNITPEDLDERWLFLKALVAISAPADNSTATYNSQTNWTLDPATAYVYGAASEEWHWNAEDPPVPVPDGDSWATLWVEANSSATVYNSGEAWPYVHTKQTLFDYVVNPSQQVDNLKRVEFVNSAARFDYQFLINTNYILIDPNLSNLMPARAQIHAYAYDPYPLWTNTNTYAYFNNNDVAVDTNEFHDPRTPYFQYTNQEVDVISIQGDPTGVGSNVFTNIIRASFYILRNIMEHGEVVSGDDDKPVGFGVDPVIAEEYDSVISVLPYYRFDISNGFKCY